ncbi:hypothetical protein F5X99DRAFT_382696 [Biscogniauxia marginata]|nr:hypothetical protein F5X99DRAFT_382696 [Biscogniauxia marginata]
MLPEEAISRELEKYRHLRKQRYSSVNVLVMIWENCDNPVFASDAEEIGRMFQAEFRYNVHHYKIPFSEMAQRSLGAYVGRFVEDFGGEGNLIIVYYGGHGCQQRPKETSYEWSALIKGGHTLDWASIQPLLFAAQCDVVILLDCCYAGQAVRTRVSHSIEFLAAADKDNWTPMGANGTWPSFTRVLVREMTAMVKSAGMVTIPGVHTRMVGLKAGLLRQPFYTSISSDDPPQVARLVRWSQGPTDPHKELKNSKSLDSEKEQAFINLRLRLLHSLDSRTTTTFIRWVTKDSPSFIADIEVDRIASEAKAAGILAEELLGPIGSKEESGSTVWSENHHKEVLCLLEALNEAILEPSPSALNDIEVFQTLDQIKKKSDALLSFVTQSLTSISPKSLRSLSTNALPSLEDLKARISMRLTLLDERDASSPIRVSFSDQPSSGQRLRLGTWDQFPVIVEYVYYDTEKRDTVSRQVAKVSALHAERKTAAFRTLHGLGYSHETLKGPRYGFVYELPYEDKSISYNLLSDAMHKARQVPLELRYRLALALCDAVLHLHSIGWLHKGLKSANVVLFSKIESPHHETATGQALDYENPYLIGFDCSRPNDAETRATVDYSTNDNIYRHPDRWGRPLRFERHHDLYALGLLLLEIGCWRTVPKMIPSKDNERLTKKPEKLKDFFLDLVKNKLPHDTGSKYADAVRRCLESSDWKSYEDWEFQATVRETIWKPLSEC